MTVGEIKLANISFCQRVSVKLLYTYSYCYYEFDSCSSCNYSVVAMHLQSGLVISCKELAKSQEKVYLFYQCEYCDSKIYRIFAEKGRKWMQRCKTKQNI